jgi:diguanylate cyclase (GGDEF)-like protein
MTEILLLLTQAWLTFALCMAAFWARRLFGLAPLFFTLGAIESMKYFAISQMLINVPLIGYVVPGSIIFYVGILAVVLVVYSREGLVPTRQLLWSLLYVSVVLSLLTMLSYEQLRLPDAQQLVGYDRALFSTSAGWRIVGTALLFIGTAATIVLYNALGRFRLPFMLRASLSLIIVVVIDSVFYDVATRGSMALTSAIFLSNMAGKAIMAIFFAYLAAIYLRYVEPFTTMFERTMHTENSDLAAALVYQKRIADLEQQLQRDPLTGAFNRRFLDHALSEQIELDSLRGEATSVLLFDLDNFKAINDRYSHLVGDLALKHLTHVLTESLRRGDSVVRFGGEEFVVLLPSTPMRNALMLADQMRQTLAETPFEYESHSITITATIGVASAPVDGSKARQLLKIADQRLYRGKCSGRNQVVAYDTERIRLP